MECSLMRGDSGGQERRRPNILPKSCPQPPARIPQRIETKDSPTQSAESRNTGGGEQSSGNREDRKPLAVVLGDAGGPVLDVSGSSDGERQGDSNEESELKRGRHFIAEKEFESDARRPGDYTTGNHHDDQENHGSKDTENELPALISPGPEYRPFNIICIIGEVGLSGCRRGFTSPRALRSTAQVDSTAASDSTCSILATARPARQGDSHSTHAALTPLGSSGGASGDNPLAESGTSSG